MSNAGKARALFLAAALGVGACAGPGDGTSGSIIASASDTAQTTEQGSSDTGGTTDDGTTTGTSDASSTTTSDATTDASTTGTTDPSTSTSTSTTTGADTVGCMPGTEGCICKLGDACDMGLMCDQGMCVGGLDCTVDPYEPNDSEATAFDLGGINDNDNQGDTVEAVLEGTADEDWFRYHGDDDFGYVADPTREISAGEGLRLCKYLECDNGIGNTDVNCPGGTTPQNSPGGRPGCCGSSSFDLSDYNCTGVTEDSVTVVMRVDSAATNSCVNYAVDYHF